MSARDLGRISQHDIMENRVMDLVIREITRARLRFPTFNSKHEGLAITEEEFLELRKSIFEHGTNEQILEEAIQTAAMAICLAVECLPEDVIHRAFIYEGQQEMHPTSVRVDEKR